MKRAPTMTSAKILDVLQGKQFKAPAHAMLREVGNSTGFEKSRSADGFVVSCWPSRGIWFAGIEVKCFRGDWLRELKSPEKSDAVQKFCHYWWIATPPGIVEKREIPETWGLLEVQGKNCEVVKDAPRLTPEPVSPLFVAAVLRKCADLTGGIRDHEYKRGRREALEEVNREPAPDEEQLRSDLSVMTSMRDSAKRNFDELNAQVRSFEAATGITIHGYRADGAVETFKKLQCVQHYDVRRMAEAYRKLADALTEAQAEVAEAQGDGAEVAAQ